MTAELGQFLLIAAFLLSLVQFGASVLGLRQPSETAFIRRLSHLIALTTTLSFGLLIAAFVQSDFSVVLIAGNSFNEKPLIFKIAATWGNHEGSILLWLVVMSLFGAWGARRFANAGLSVKAEVWTLLSQAVLFAMFAAFVIWTSNPFERQFPVPLQGADLNPLLQDIGLAIHPPLLYVGYVGFSVTFAFAVGGLMDGKIDQAWARAVRPLALMAWSFLTFGIAMGSWWASYELGWGGWWFWDPVENLSLMPWLTGTALIHCLVALEKRDTLRAWTAFLALLTFGASILGTFVVRSGVLTSVHSFAVDPARGSFILAIAVISLGVAFLIFALRAPNLPDGKGFGLACRENAIVVNNLLLCSAFGAVFIGTFYPVIAELFGGGRPSVGAPFYNATFTPMMVVLLVAMAAGPLMVWRLDLNVKRWLGVLTTVLPTGLVLGVIVFAVFQRFEPLALGAVVIAGSVISGGVGAFYRATKASGRLALQMLAMPLAHLGLGIAVLGMVGASVWVDEHLVALKPGETKALADTEWTVQMLETTEREEPNYRAVVVPLVVTNGDTTLRLNPERRQYTVRQEPTTELDTARSLKVNLGLTDVFATIGSPTETGRIVTKVVFRPMQILLWIGALIMLLGGLLGSFGAMRQGRRS